MKNKIQILINNDANSFFIYIFNIIFKEIHSKITNTNIYELNLLSICNL